MLNDKEPVLNKQAALKFFNDDEDLFLEIAQAYLKMLWNIPNICYMLLTQAIPIR
jgi:hypothetical protein